MGAMVATPRLLELRHRRQKLERMGETVVLPPERFSDEYAEPDARPGAAAKQGDTVSAADAAEWRRRRDKLRKRDRDAVPRDLGPARAVQRAEGVGSRAEALRARRSGR